jgi:hypothetical protein
VGLAGEVQCDGINEINVPLNQPGKSRLRIAAGEIPNQVHVVRVCHLLIIPDQRRNWTIIFALFNWQSLPVNTFGSQKCSRASG